MEKFETRFDNFDDSLEVLNKKIVFLQDIILNLKEKFEIINRNNITQEFLVQLTTEADKNFDHFLNERPTHCHITDKCTTIAEKAIFKILRIFIDSGPSEALDYIKDFRNKAMKLSKEENCPDKMCFNNIYNIFKTLANLINTSFDSSLSRTKELISIGYELSFEEGAEGELCKLIAPLSNEKRLVILKTLSKGGKYYTQLEKEIGIKGGHLIHHLKSLMDVGYIEKSEGKYMISINGLMILRFLNKLKLEITNLKSE